MSVAVSCCGQVCAVVAGMLALTLVYVFAVLELGCVSVRARVANSDTLAMIGTM